jgi:hypothetical protein
MVFLVWNEQRSHRPPLDTTDPVRPGDLDA